MASEVMTDEEFRAHIKRMVTWLEVTESSRPIPREWLCLELPDGTIKPYNQSTVPVKFLSAKTIRVREVLE